MDPPTKAPSATATLNRGVWSTDEHDRFLEAIELYPNGPWGVIAAMVGTRSPRQVQTHAQKYYDKIARRLRGLQRDRNALNGREHRIEAYIIKLVSTKSPELEAVRHRVSQVSRARARGITISSEPTTGPASRDDAVPPCLQRLRVLPRSADFHSSSEVVAAKDDVFAIGEPLAKVDNAPLPPLDQALDFLLENLDDAHHIAHDPSAAVSHSISYEKTPPAVHGFAHE